MGTVNSSGVPTTSEGFLVAIQRSENRFFRANRALHLLWAEQTGGKGYLQATN